MSWGPRPAPAPLDFDPTQIVGLDPASLWHLGPGLQDFIPTKDAPPWVLVPFIVQTGKLADCRLIRALLTLIQLNQEISAARENNPNIRSRILPPGPFLPVPINNDPDALSFTNQLAKFILGQIAVGAARKILFEMIASPKRAIEIIDLDIINPTPYLRARLPIALETLRTVEKELQVSPPIRAEAAQRVVGGIPFFEDFMAPALRPASVVLGVIDQGIDPDAAHLTDAQGKPRVVSFWRQDFDYDDDDGAVPFGYEVRRLPFTPYGSTNHDGTYRGGLGDQWLRDFSAYRHSHGAHVLGTFAADDPLVITVEDAPIVAVELSRDVVKDTSGASLDAAILMGVYHIIERARLLGGGTMPDLTVINISYGYTSGTRGLSRMVVRELNQLITCFEGRLRIALPAGNARQSRVFANFTAQATTKTLPLRVQPDDKTPSFIEVWAGEDKDLAAELSVRVTAPTGEASAWVTPTRPLQVLEKNGVAASLSGHTCPVTERGYLRLAIQPTSRTLDMQDGPLAPAGVWKIDATSTVAREVDVWVQRDDTVTYYRRAGRQSYFDDPAYERFDEGGRPLWDDRPGSSALTKRGRMVSAIAHQSEGDVAYAELGAEHRLANYSAKPAPGAHWAAVADDSLVHFGVFGPAGADGAQVALNGTSVAAPRVARHILDEARANEDTSPPVGRVGPNFDPRRTISKV